jgi:dihydroorotase
VDIFDREAVFIDEVLAQVTSDFSELKIVFEHITTKNAVDFVRESSDNIAATISMWCRKHTRTTTARFFVGFGMWCRICT